MERVKGNEFTMTTAHLANERTFLGWMRTGMALMGVGFVLEKYDLFLLKVLELVTTLERSKATVSNMQGSSVRLGIIMVEIGVIFAVLSTIKYRITEKQIQNLTQLRCHVLDTLLILTITAAGVIVVIHIMSTK
ncbi:MAG: DUF202 domain-containing protein [Nitrospirae bacterium]|nr:DUF202 domain-containing protein [Nitrospirota bacterium]